jgi:hypothetical protein
MAQQTPSKNCLTASMTRILLALLITAAIAFIVAPDLAKPLLVKYYRALYSAEVIRNS